MYDMTQLDNGLKVVSSRLADVNSLAIGIWIKTGGRYESKSNQGISHVMEHMLFKGTRNRSCKALKKSIESKGGAFNAFTSEESVCFYIKILSDKLSLASDVLADMVLRPLFRKDDLEKEKKVIFEEIRMYLDLPMYYVHDIFDSLIWPNHPLGLPLVGNYKTVSRISPDDLFNQQERFYAPNNMSVVACGNIDHKMLVSMINDLFYKQKTVKQPIPKKVKPGIIGNRFELIHKETEQTHLCMGFRGLSNRHPKRYALCLLNIVLGGNMSSRLFNEIREKRSLAYEIGSSVKAYHDTGSFLVHAGIDNSKLVDAVSVIINEISKIRERYISKSELQMAKEYFKSGLLMTMENTMSNMLLLGEQITSAGRIQKKEYILEQVDKVTRDDIKLVAEKLFIDNGLRLAAIGPQTKKQRDRIGEMLERLKQG
jgi:predicted Zn-dependent peptidase